MNRVSLKKNEPPKLRIPEMEVDVPIHDKLLNNPLLANMAYSHFCCFYGKPGQGKTSTVIMLLDSKDAFKSCFHKIYLFMPYNSRQSIKDKFFDKNLDESQIYDELDYESLEKVYNECQENARKGLFTLIIFDDVQRAFREDPNIEKLFLKIVNNRRHSKISIWCLIQNYKKLSPQTRAVITDMFIFNVSKAAIQDIFDEHIKLDKKTFQEIQKIIYPTERSFVFLNTNNQKIFSNWDEIIIED